MPKSQKSDELPILLTFGREVKRKPSFSLSRRNLPVKMAPSPGRVATVNPEGRAMVDWPRAGSVGRVRADFVRIGFRSITAEIEGVRDRTIIWRGLSGCPAKAWFGGAEITPWRKVRPS